MIKTGSIQTSEEATVQSADVSDEPFEYREQNCVTFRESVIRSTRGGWDADALSGISCQCEGEAGLRQVTSRRRLRFQRDTHVRRCQDGSFLKSTGTAMKEGEDLLEGGARENRGIPNHVFLTFNTPVCDVIEYAEGKGLKYITLSITFCRIFA